MVIIKSSWRLRLYFLTSIIILIFSIIYWFWIVIKYGALFWWMGSIIFLAALYMANKIKSKCFVYVFEKYARIYQEELIYDSKNFTFLRYLLFKEYLFNHGMYHLDEVEHILKRIEVELQNTVPESILTLPIVGIILAILLGLPWKVFGILTPQAMANIIGIIIFMMIFYFFLFKSDSDKKRNLLGLKKFLNHIKLDISCEKHNREKMP